MSIDITIKQTNLIKKTLPLEVITGNVLAYGEYEYDHLEPDSIGNGEIVLYDPSRIGRGFSVTWTPKEKKAISLRLIHPTTKEELRAFCDTVERIANSWTNTRIKVDGVRTSLADFLASFDDMVEFNEKTLAFFCRKVINGEHNDLALHSALWLLFLDHDNAKIFMDSPESFGDWLHTKQTAANVYNSPMLWGTQESPIGVYAFVGDCRYIMPKSPSIPFGMVFSGGGKINCNVWKVMLPQKTTDADQMVADYSKYVTADYFRFLDIIPEDRISEYDSNHILIEPFTDQELLLLIDKLDEQGYVDHQTY